MIEMYKETLKKHRDGMLARQQEANRKVKDFQIEALSIQSEREKLEEMIRALEILESKSPDKRCGSCEWIREGVDSENCVNHRCVVDKSTGVHLIVWEDKKGCDKWEVMR